jgi:hypothetical protein
MKGYRMMQAHQDCLQTRGKRRMKVNTHAAPGALPQRTMPSCHRITDDVDVLLTLRSKHLQGGKPQSEAVASSSNMAARTDDHVDAYRIMTSYSPHTGMSTHAGCFAGAPNVHPERTC